MFTPFSEVLSFAATFRGGWGGGGGGGGGAIACVASVLQASSVFLCGQCELCLERAVAVFVEDTKPVFCDMANSIK